MITALRNSLLINILWGVMALYLLNISVDTADLNPQSVPEDLSINDQESIVEIILEKILGYENAIEEYDDNDKEGQHKNSNVKLDFIARSFVIVIISLLNIETCCI
ncbi:hypothetical protein DNU06_04440 [Putridiphycobacter roseus]|uniref:Uncharacterized protein n=1 Tax=Putridiphycobacter roseus TaxID=2219161 RepID=A0A2W1NQF6_9FLAO|nr:hypothetical protein [Putridiphycobacter roseus]PZE17872.1 hypothetical protein DNU06_04440 [Putridiphycobacter roseus]